MSEEVAKIQFYQISHAIAYLHANNICHRDLKTENILMMSKDARAHLKISDFGLSKKFSSTSMLETYAGTPVRFIFFICTPNIYIFAYSELHGS